MSRTLQVSVTAMHKIAESGRRNQTIHKIQPMVKSRDIVIKENMTRSDFIKQVLTVHGLQDIYLVGEVSGPAFQTSFWGS